MSRALREYEVLGIRTTIPFFLWLMRQAEYVEGRYDTTYLDRLLADRNGQSFSELSEAEEELATSAVAIDAFFARTRNAPGGDGRRRHQPWKQAARREALRE